MPLLLLAPAWQRPPTNSIPTARPAPLPTVRAIELIAPGTVIDKAAPKGWSHLVLKSQPRLPDDERRKISELAANLSTIIFTAVTVGVEAHGDPKRYRLAKIGMGVGVKIDGQDVIVSPDTQARLGANLGLLARKVHAAVHDKLKDVRVAAAGSTVAVVDTPAFMPRGKGHAMVVLRYVFFVDVMTGQLDTLVWRIDTDGKGGYEGTVGQIEWLPPNMLIDAEMQVDPSEFTLGVPSERAFAVKRIPEGKRQFTMPDGLRHIAGAAKLTSEQASALTKGMREMVTTAR